VSALFFSERTAMVEIIPMMITTSTSSINERPRSGVKSGISLNSKLAALSDYLIGIREGGFTHLAEVYASLFRFPDGRRGFPKCQKRKGGGDFFVD
jgi:hypothetical protein